MKFIKILSLKVKGLCSHVKRRPLTPLNVDYKILAKAVGQRIEPILFLIKKFDQTGSIKGRFISQNVRLLNDVMEYTEAKTPSGIVLFSDFHKALRHH